ncbi:MAG: hypothetical protein PVF49_03480 [Anaerolineales bacterium]|jgi:hypothetical protein
MSSNGNSKLTKQLIPIYTTPGDCTAVLVFPYLYNLRGEWIGFVTSQRDVYDVDGLYVGWITDEPRILRKRVVDDGLTRIDPPDRPTRIRPPGTVPLPPMMAELPFAVIDVLDEQPERLHTLDSGELKEDMD